MKRRAFFRLCLGPDLARASMNGAINRLFSRHVIRHTAAQNVPTEKIGILNYISIGHPTSITLNRAIRGCP
jgi:hypothetical protein